MNSHSELRRAAGSGRGYHLVALVLLVVTACWRPASALVVREISVRSQSGVPVDMDYVLALTQLRAGMDMDQHVVNRDVRALLGTGLYASVGAELQTLNDDEARLVYVLEIKRTLAAPVEIDGARRYRAATMRDWSGLKGGDRVSDQDAAVAAARVRDRLHQKRYYYARVDARIVPVEDDPSLATVRLTVDEGPRTHLDQVFFSGNTVFTDFALRRTMRLPRPWNPINWVRKHRYQPDQLDLARDLVGDQYRDAGYLDVHVGPAELQEVEPGRVQIRLPIAEGPRYRVGEIKIEGVEVLDAGDLMRAIELRSGAIASSGRIESAAQQLRDAYAAAGYRRTRVMADLLPRVGEPDVIDVRFGVQEGTLTDLRMVYIRGNRKTRDKVIRRELLVAPGDRYDEARIRRSENRLRNLGFFSYVASYAEDWAPGVSDVVFEVEEKQTGQFMIGAGFSSIDNVIGFVEVSQSNFDLFNWPWFTGGGQKLKLRAQFGSESKDYEISFVEPWFLDRRLALSLDGYIQQRSYKDYEVERVGGAVGLGVPLRGPHRLDFGYRLERIDLIKVADTNAYVGADGEVFYFQEPGRRDKSTFNLSLTRDTRDSFMMPARGHRLRIGGTYSGGLLGFDTDLYTLDGRGAVHFPLWRGHILSLQGRVEIVEAHDPDDDVPLSDRLFAGGPRTVRGFKYRDVGPKAIRVLDDGSVSRRPQGGRTLALAGAEYTVPLVEGIRLAGFVDAANVWLDAYELHPDDMAVGAGFGLRFDLPGFPIRLDYAWPLRRDDEFTRSERFSFWIGHGF